MPISKVQADCIASEQMMHEIRFAQLTGNLDSELVNRQFGIPVTISVRDIHPTVVDAIINTYVELGWTVSRYRDLRGGRYLSFE